MENLCSIFHKKHSVLKKIAGTSSKAELLSQCLFWWQTSKYTLKNSSSIWFTRPYKQISEELEISLSSVNRWLSEFENNNLIERRTELSSTTKSGMHQVVKRTYIKITDNLISQLTDTTNKPLSCSETKQQDIIDNSSERFSIYKEQDYKQTNNTIVTITLPVDKNTNSQKQKKEYPQFPIEKIMGECLEESSKNYIKGMLYNLQKQHLVKISSPEQAFAEIVFSITNQEQLKGIENFKHRVNIIAQLLRQNRWKTPKGFYSQTDYGKLFQKRDWTKSVTNIQSDETTKTMKKLQIHLNQITAELNTEIKFRDSSKKFLSQPQQDSLELKIMELQAKQEKLIIELEFYDKKTAQTKLQSRDELIDDLNIVNKELKIQLSQLENRKKSYIDMELDPPKYADILDYIRTLEERKKEILQQLDIDDNKNQKSGNTYPDEWETLERLRNRAASLYNKSQKIWDKYKLKLAMAPEKTTEIQLLHEEYNYLINSMDAIYDEIDRRAGIQLLVA